jgi:hypothetical protein
MNAMLHDQNHPVTPPLGEMTDADREIFEYLRASLKRLRRTSRLAHPTHPHELEPGISAMLTRVEERLAA